jgi:hypothetical protein
MTFVPLTPGFSPALGHTTNAPLLAGPSTKEHDMDTTCGQGHEPQPGTRSARPSHAPAIDGRPPAAASEPEEQAGRSLSQAQADGVPQVLGRRPGYVIVAWVSEQLRDKIQRNGASLAEALQATGREVPEPAPKRSDSAGA